MAALLRGAFLACGTLTDPEKDYHLEFVVPYRYISRDLAKLLHEWNLAPKQLERKGSHVVYCKDSERIEEILTLMGAQNAALELMGIKMYKDMRNNINRKINFETANISRTANAAAEQVYAIETILEHAGLESLPEELKEIALLRLENPEMSLRELGRRFLNRFPALASIIVSDDWSPLHRRQHPAFLNRKKHKRMDDRCIQ